MRRWGGCRKRKPSPPAPTTSAPKQPVKILYPAAPGSFVKLAQRLRPSVVQLSTTVPVRGGPADWFPRGSLEDRTTSGAFGERLRRSLGTGFVLDKQGHILTNAHVVRRAEQVRAHIGEVTMPAQVLGQDEDADVALLRVKPKAGVRLIPVLLGDSDQLKAGEWVAALGNPFGQGISVGVGVVSALPLRDLVTGKPGLWGLIQTDADIHPGNSGGPLINVQGEVVGIATAVDRQAGRLGFAVPINAARGVVRLLKRSGRTERAWVGLYMDQVTEVWAKKVGLDRAHGALVTGVVAGGPGERAGIVDGDIILEFEGREVDDHRTLPRWVALAGVNTGVTVKVWRAKKTLTLKVTTASMPD